MSSYFPQGDSGAEYPGEAEAKRRIKKLQAEIERLRNLYRTERRAHYDADACLVRGTEEWQAETEHNLEQAAGPSSGNTPAWHHAFIPGTTGTPQKRQGGNDDT